MLSVISVEEAIALSKSLVKNFCRTEVLPLSSLTGRVSAEDVYCSENIPSFRRSTMDGYAVIASDTFGAGEAAPCDLTVAGEVIMGEETHFSLKSGLCAKIPTGGMLPDGADAVIPVEYTDTDFDTCLVYRPVGPKENVVQSGDDVAKESLLFSSGTRFTPAHIGVLAAAGKESCRVLCRPKVGILSTGNEIVSVGESLSLGKVRDVNSHLLFSLCQTYGCEPVSYGIVTDSEKTLTETLLRAADENDLVLLSGGSSAGEKDHTAKAVSALGELLAHGVAMKPGKPTMIGKISNTPVFGLPGHPAACYFAFEALVKPCIEKLSGAMLLQKQLTAALSENISSNHGREEFVPVSLKNSVASPVYGKSGIISQLCSSDGYIRISRNSEGLPAGSEVTVHLF